MADIQLQTLDSTANIDHIYGYATSPQEPSTALAIDHYPGALADFTQVKIQSPGLDELYLSSPVASPTPTFARQFDIVSGSTAQVLGDFQVGTLGPQNEPLIGPLRPAKLLIRDDVSNSPDLVREAMKLLQRFGPYRPIRRDGNCAWRALSLGYFEKLAKTRDINLIAAEEARFRVLNANLQEGGFEKFGYEIFANVTFATFQTLLESFGGDPDQILAPFANEHFSDSIVTHFKLLTSAWLLKYLDCYEATFLPISPDDFRKQYIEPFNLSLTEPGLNAAVDCIFTDSPFSVEIATLNTEFGGEVSVKSAGIFNVPGVGTRDEFDVLTLLRTRSPNRDDYDILHPAPDLSPSPASVPLPLSPISTLAPTLSIPVSIYPHTPEDSYFPMHDINEYTTSPTAPLSPSSPSNFRPSMFQLPEFQPTPLPTVPFQTATFKNSPFNPSHYQSANFQPELYRPELDDGK